MLRIAVPSVLQQSTVSIGMMIVQAVVNPFGTQALAGYAATMRVENVFSLIFVTYLPYPLIHRKSMIKALFIVSVSGQPRFSKFYEYIVFQLTEW